MPTSRNLLYVGPPGADEPHLDQALSADWAVHTAADPDQARELVDRDAFLVGLVDLDHTGPSVEELLGAASRTQWVALTSGEALEQPTYGRLIRQTCFDYHTRPLDPQRLTVTLGHAWGMAQLGNGVTVPKPDADEYEMVGTSAAMHRVFHAIRKVAAVEAPVLVLGESGTGKELAARAIHERSERAAGTFVAVNCGALPENLVHSELFGHEKGAFTGAHQQRIGRLEAADGGTIFLDEIGDLPLELQVNLLRFLQESRIQRVGGTEEIPVDVRVLAATHKDLDAEVAAGRFREDLYYRLNVLHLRVPPLRERDDDIEVLANFYFEKFAREREANVRGFTNQALKVMRAHDWPGNVREMINRIRRAMVMGDNRLITADDLGLDRRSGPRNIMTLAEARAEAEKRAVKAALHQTGNNITQASRVLDVSRPTLYRLMEQYQVEAGP